jgi:hypothetical protein
VLSEARDSLSNAVASRRAERTALWHDSTVFQDSFFAPDSRLDSATNSEFAGLHAAAPLHGRRLGLQGSTAQDDDASVGGIVTDEPPRIAANSRH